MINFETKGDSRGALIAIEGGKEIPFDIKRIFYIYGTLDGISRGEHSHYKTRQVLVAVNGTCQVTLDDGKSKKTYLLDRPNIGLLQDALVWGEMHDFSPDCTLLVLTDTPYEESDYIKSYDSFLEIVNGS